MSTTLNHSFAKAALSGEKDQERRENISLVLIRDPAALLLTTYKQSGLFRDQKLSICDAWTTDLASLVDAANQHVDCEWLRSCGVDYLQTAAKHRSLTVEAAASPGPLTCCVQPRANTPTAWLCSHSSYCFRSAWDARR